MIESPPSTLIQVQPSSSKLPLVLVGLILMLTAGAGGVYLGKYLSAPKTPPASPVVTPTQTPIATPTVDPTENWTTYTNTKYSFEIKYPKSDPNDPSGQYNSYTENLLEISGLDSLIIRIEPIQTSETDPAMWWKSQKTEVYTKKSVTCFTQQTATSVKSLYDPNQSIINFGRDVLILNNFHSKGTCLEPPEVQMLLIPLNGRIIKITYDWAALSEQILSTFKFISTEASLWPADAQTSAAGICADPIDGAMVSIIINTDTPTPRCSKVLPTQKLRLVNNTDKAITVNIAKLNVTIESEQDYVFNETLGSFLAPGVHHVSISPYGGPEIWLED